MDPHHFLRIRIRIQLNKICNKLPYEEYFEVKKDSKDCSKVKKTLMDPDQGPGGKINVDPDPQPWWTVEYSMYNDRTR